MPRGGARKGAGRPCTKEKTKPVRIPERMLNTILEFVSNNGYQYPLYSSTVSAGVPLPTDDDIQNKLDLNQLLIKNPAHTFLVKVSGESMINAGIHSGDILVVDRNIEAKNGKIIVAAVDGQLTVKRLLKNKKECCLMPENPKFKPIKIADPNQIHIWGVVTNVIHSL